MKLPAPDSKIAVVIPAYRVRHHLAQVIAAVPPGVCAIYVVDDACPEKSYESVPASSIPIHVIHHPVNQGVGGATLSGFQAAFDAGCDVAVKVDGDGQMRLDYLDLLLAPIRNGFADFTKGNRFVHLNELQSMPAARRIGNIGLSFLTKVASGHWNITDPSNGFVAIHREAFRRINTRQIDRRYFFETSLLIHLNIARAVVCDVPIPALYGSERSNLSITRTLFCFPQKLLRHAVRRFVWRYLFYDINATTFLFCAGALLTTGGAGFGIYRWVQGAVQGAPQTAGTVALSLLPSILGTQMLLHALILDVIDQPRRSLQALTAIRQTGPAA